MAEVGEGEMQAVEDAMSGPAPGYSFDLHGTVV